MNTKLKVLIIIIVALLVITIPAIVSGLFFSEYFIVAPLFIKRRNMIVKRTSAQEYAQREALMIKEASQWVLDYQQDEASRLKFSDDIRNIMDR